MKKLKVAQDHALVVLVPSGQTCSYCKESKEIAHPVNGSSASYGICVDCVAELGKIFKEIGKYPDQV